MKSEGKQRDKERGCGEKDGGKVIRTSLMKEAESRERLLEWY